MQIQLVGQMSLSEIVFLLWFVFNVMTGKQAALLSDRNIRKLTMLYGWLFFSQLISEIMVGNEFSNAAKGLAVTIVSYVKFICLWSVVRKDGRRLMFLFLFMAVVGLFNMELEDEGVEVADILKGTAYVFFKFKVAPLIGMLLVVMSLLKRNVRMSLMFVVAGGFCIVLGARSTGLMIFLTGAVVYAIEHMRRISKQQVMTWCIVGSVVGYVLFAIYVSVVLDGTIISGNSSTQIARLKDPYNPLNVLLSGRTESASSLAAISDRPFTGFGAWAEDPGYKYHMIAAEYQDENISMERILNSRNLIPAHSVILGTGVNNGIFAMFVMFIILWFFIRSGAKALYKGNEYNYLIVFCIMQLIWNGLFSPVSHFRGAFPIYFCCCLYAYERMLLLKRQKV